jgi:hypothetical protein
MDFQRKLICRSKNTNNEMKWRVAGLPQVVRTSLKCLILLNILDFHPAAKAGSRQLWVGADKGVGWPCVAMFNVISCVKEKYINTIFFILELMAY